MDVSSPYIHLLLRICHESWLRMKTWIYKCARLIVKLVFPWAGKRNTLTENIAEVDNLRVLSWKALRRRCRQVQGTKTTALPVRPRGGR